MSHSRDDPGLSASSPAASTSSSSVDAEISKLSQFGNLVVSRTRGEAIIFSVNCTPVARVTVADIRGDKVRIACESLPSVRIDREQIFYEVLAETDKLTLDQKSRIRIWLANNKAR